MTAQPAAAWTDPDADRAWRKAMPPLPLDSGVPLTTANARWLGCRHPRITLIEADLDVWGAWQNGRMWPRPEAQIQVWVHARLNGDMRLMRIKDVRVDLTEAQGWSYAMKLLWPYLMAMDPVTQANTMAELTTPLGLALVLGRIITPGETL